MSVIVGISARSDFTLQNAGFRVLKEIAFAAAEGEDDRRVLESAGWSHFLDLTRLDWPQAQRIAWLLDAAARIRIEDWLAEGTDSSLAGAGYYEQLVNLLRDSYGPPPDAENEPAPFRITVPFDDASGS